MSIVNVKGTLELPTTMLAEDIEEIKRVVVESGIDANIEDDVIFFENTFDDSVISFEAFAVIAAHKLPIGHEDMTFFITGHIADVTNGRYDIIIRKNKVFIQYYDLVLGELEEYKG